MPSRERAEGYPKRASDSIGSEKTIVGSAWPDANKHGPGAFWAVALICRLVSIDVNPCVDATTGELNTDKSASASVLLPPIDGSGVARQVQVFTRYLPEPHKPPNFPILRLPGRQDSGLGVLGKDRILQSVHLGRRNGFAEPRCLARHSGIPHPAQASVRCVKLDRERYANVFLRPAARQNRLSRAEIWRTGEPLA